MTGSDTHRHPQESPLPRVSRRPRSAGHPDRVGIMVLAHDLLALLAREAKRRPSAANRGQAAA